MASRLTLRSTDIISGLSALALLAIGGAWTNTAFASTGADARCDQSVDLPRLLDIPAEKLTIPEVVFEIVSAISAYIIWKWPFSIQFPSVGGPFDDTFRGPLWNWSPWPFGLILLPILIFSKKISTKMGISPFLSPYIGVHSLIGPLIALSTTNFWLFLLGWIFLWIRWWKMVNVGL